MNLSTQTTVSQPSRVQLKLPTSISQQAQTANMRQLILLDQVAKLVLIQQLTMR